MPNRGGGSPRRYPVSDARPPMLSLQKPDSWIDTAPAPVQGEDLVRCRMYGRGQDERDATIGQRTTAPEVAGTRKWGRGLDGGWSFAQWR